MESPLQIYFKQIDKDDAVEALIRDRVAKLERVCDHIISCRVTVAMDNKKGRTGNPIRVTIDLRVPPGHEVVARRESNRMMLEGDARPVIIEAFEAAEQQLRKLAEQQQGEVKVHPEQTVEAIVTTLLRDEGYGFVKTLDGRDVYFHKNSVLRGDFDRMDVGTGVNLSVEMGEEGPQATSLQIVDKPSGQVSGDSAAGGARGEGRSGVKPPLGWE